MYRKTSVADEGTAEMFRGGGTEAISGRTATGWILRDGGGAFPRVTVAGDGDGTRDRWISPTK